MQGAMSLIEQVFRAITEGRALDRLRCLCLTRPQIESGFRSPRCLSHRTGMHGVSHLTMHSSFTPAADACPTAQFGQVVLSECDASSVCLAVYGFGLKYATADPTRHACIIHSQPFRSEYDSDPLLTQPLLLLHGL
jgi:hypothetical protein